MKSPYLFTTNTELKEISHERLIHLGFSWSADYFSNAVKYSKEDIEITYDLIGDERVFFYSDTLEPIKFI